MDSLMKEHMLEIEKLKLEHEEKIATFEQQEYEIKELEENTHSLEVLLEEKRVELNSLKGESFRVKEKLMDAHKKVLHKVRWSSTVLWLFD